MDKGCAYMWLRREQWAWTMGHRRVGNRHAQWAWARAGGGGVVTGGRLRMKWFSFILKRMAEIKSVVRPCRHEVRVRDHERGDKLSAREPGRELHSVVS